MENWTVKLFILAIMIGLSAMADKVKLPYPILLIVADISMGFIPTLPPMEINPEIIFLIFLPPLLDDAAFNISFQEFKTNLNTLLLNINYILAEELHVNGSYSYSNIRPFHCPF